MNIIFHTINSKISIARKNDVLIDLIMLSYFKHHFITGQENLPCVSGPVV